MNRLRFSALVILTALWLIAGGYLMAQSAKPLAEDDVRKLIELQIDDVTVIGKIEKAGVAFAANDETLEKLKRAGASPAVLAAIRKSGERKSSSAPEHAVTYQDVLKLLELGIGEQKILDRLAKSPTLFTLDSQQVDELKKAGASEKLLAAMQGRGGTALKGDVTDLAIILDCSGSMRDRTKEGPSKMESAKRIVTDLIGKIPNGRRLTFLVYGHNVEEKCQAVKVVRPLSELDDSGKDELARFIATLRPVGYTPIALAFRVAEKELAKSDGLSGLILITDGMETCHGDPNAEAARLASNPKLVFGLHIIGFGVEPQELAAVEAIAKAGHGKFYDADSATKLEEAVAELAKKIEKPQPIVDRPDRKIELAGTAVKAGAFFHDAPIIKAGEYKGALAFMQADYYQVPVGKGQELRIIAKVQKSAFRVMNPFRENDTETFSITVYDHNLKQLAREQFAAPGTPSTPATFKLSWQAADDDLVYVAVAATAPHDEQGRRSFIYSTDGSAIPPSAYTLTIKLNGNSEAGEPLSAVPRAEAAAGNSFAAAGVLPVPGLAATDLKLGEVAFYKAPIKQGGLVRISVAAQKPLFRVENEGTQTENQATYTLTVYDEDQVQVAQKKLDVPRNPPEAQSFSLIYAAKDGNHVYFSVSCDNTGHKVYVPRDDSPPGPGRVAIQLTPTTAEAAAREPIDEPGKAASKRPRR